MFAPLVSPSLLIKREIMAVACAEAVRYRTTVREVVEAFFAGRVRPELARQLEQAEAAAGIPPSELMGLVGQYLEVDTIEMADVIAMLSAHQGALPNAIQVRELGEAMTRLGKRARAHERRVRAIQAAHDAAGIETAMVPPPALGRERRRQVRARSVQRYSGLER